MNRRNNKQELVSTRPLCACGCLKPVKLNSKGKLNRYLKGHRGNWVNQDGRICTLCLSNSTYIHRGTNTPNWHYLNGKLICSRCYRKLWGKRNYNKIRNYRKINRKYLYTLQRTWKLAHKERVNELERINYHKRKSNKRGNKTSLSMDE
jgi:hypothetical protein